MLEVFRSFGGYKSLFCWRMECKQSWFLKIQYFIIRELTFLNLLKSLTSGTYILRYWDRWPYRAVYTFLRRCPYVSQHVGSPSSCEGQRLWLDLVWNVSVDRGCLTRMCMRFLPMLSAYTWLNIVTYSVILCEGCSLQAETVLNIRVEMHFKVPLCLWPTWYFASDVFVLVWLCFCSFVSSSVKVYSSAHRSISYSTVV